eukprot:scaffold34343_cov74-Phaeocystis_antarctica.AAC.2
MISAGAQPGAGGSSCCEACELRAYGLKPSPSHGFLDVAPYPIECELLLAHILELMQPVAVLGLLLLLLRRAIHHQQLASRKAPERTRRHVWLDSSLLVSVRVDRVQRAHKG